jgi:AcrR family transcriptional regulator
MARLPHLTARGRETQRVLRDTIMQLMLEKDFEQITVKDITGRAGIDRTTFYLHFTDKHDLLEQSRRQVIDELFAQSMAAAAPGDVLLQVFQRIAGHATAFRALLASADATLDRRLHDYVAAGMGPLLRARLESSGEGAELMLDLLAQYVTSALRGTARWWLEQGMPYSPDEMASIFRQLLVGGLSAAVPMLGSVAE